MNKDELQQHIARFREYETTCATVTTGWRQMAELMKQRGWEPKEFHTKTLLNRIAYERIIYGHNSAPSMHTILAVCVGLELGIPATQSVLASAGHTLSEAIPSHRAYLYILRYLRGAPIRRMQCVHSKAQPTV